MDLFDEEIILGDNKNLINRDEKKINIFNDLIGSEDENEDIGFETNLNQKNPFDLTKKSGFQEFDDDFSGIDDTIDVFDGFNRRMYQKELNTENTLSNQSEYRDSYKNTEHNTPRSQVETGLGIPQDRDHDSPLQNSSDPVGINGIGISPPTKNESDTKEDGNEEETRKRNYGAKKQECERKGIDFGNNSITRPESGKERFGASEGSSRNDNVPSNTTLSGTGIDWKKVWNIVENTEKHINSLGNSRDLFKSILQELALGAHCSTCGDAPHVSGVHEFQ
ncbi:hypothetical protein HWI79_1927 [Cryptosporidium felis]|nr:hypothetical protein HWI79_1927 [Cryptosporidium felis]